MTTALVKYCPRLLGAFTKLPSNDTEPVTTCNPIMGYSQFEISKSLRP